METNAEHRQGDREWADSQMSVDIWELARKKVQEKEESRNKRDDDLENQGESNSPSKEETTVIVCGGKSSGKSSIILRFLDKNETTRPTTALEYMYARRMRGNNKQLCHLWELGGGTRLSSLLHVPITKKVVTSLSIVIVIDLMKPHDIRPTVEGLLGTAKKEVDRAMQELNVVNPSEYDALKEEMKERNDRNKELSMCDPFPVPIAFIGSKYDEFQNRESEERRKICKLLRFLAHYYGASLVFHSSRMETTLSKGRLLFAHFAFSASLGRTSQTDMNKPLFIPYGTDSFADIGAPPSSDNSYSSLKASQPIDLWWAVFSESFPSSDSKAEKIVDPSVDSRFSEPTLDDFIEQKKRDLEMYSKQKKERIAAEERAEHRLHNGNA